MNTPKTIGALIADLKMVKNQNANVYFDFAGCQPTSIDSWRGVYAEPALGWQPTGYSASVPDSSWMSVMTLIEELERACVNTYEGWKGGEYRYGTTNTIHIDNPGDCSHTFIGVVEDAGHMVILHTFHLDR